MQRAQMSLLRSLAFIWVHESINMVRLWRYFWLNLKSLEFHNSATRRPHLHSARNEVRCSCHGVASTTRNTSDAAPCFDYPVGDARQSCATGCKRASLQIPFAPVNRTFALAAVTWPLKRVAKVSPAR